MADYTQRIINKIKGNPNGLPWKCVVVDGSALGLGGSDDPSAEEVRDGVLWGFQMDPTPGIVYYDIMIPPGYKEGSDIYVHLEWTIDTAGSGGGEENVKWDFTYSWANKAEIIPTSTSASLTVDVQDKAQYELMDHEICVIDGHGKRVDSTIIGSLTLDDSASDPYADIALFVHLEFWYQAARTGTYFIDSPLRGKLIEKVGTPKEKYRPGAW